MENGICRCEKCRHHYVKHNKRYHKKRSYSSNSSNDSKRKQSIKINVDCNRGGEEAINHSHCSKVLQHDYKEDLLKYLIYNKPSISNNKYINGIIISSFDIPKSKQFGTGYIAVYINKSSEEQQWIISIDCNKILHFTLTPINNKICNNATVDDNSIELHNGVKPYFKNPIIINVKEPLYGFGFSALCN
jgi:hypothetical protein